MAQNSRPYIKLSAKQIIQKGEQFLESADMDQLQILLVEISKRKKAEKKLAPLKNKIEKKLSGGTIENCDSSHSAPKTSDKKNTSKQVAGKKNQSKRLR